MRQNTLRLAPKRNAKCTKTQGKMHQNAGQNAPKRRVKCTKTQGECKNMQCTKEPKKCFNRLKQRAKRGKMML